jgi:hypothetical protein
LIAAAFFAGGYVTIPMANPVLAKGQEPPTVLVTLTPFIFFLVGILLAFIALIILLATLFNHKVPDALHRNVTRALIAGIFIGLVGMIQPLQIELYNWGFLLLFACTLLYIVWSHLVPRSAPLRESEATTISARELEQREALPDA